MFWFNFILVSKSLLFVASVLGNLKLVLCYFYQKLQKLVSTKHVFGDLNDKIKIYFVVYI